MSILLIFSFAVCFSTASFAATSTESYEIRLAKQIIAKKTDGSSDVISSNGFGNSVSIYGDLAIVGIINYMNTDNNGAYIFGKNVGGEDNWGIIKKLVPVDDSGTPLIAKNRKFGEAVAISDKYAIVGAPEDDAESKTKAGRVYIFGKDQGGDGNWGLIKSVNAGDGEGSSDTKADALFGKSIALNGDSLIVGSPNYDASGTQNSGAAYILDKNKGSGWEVFAKLLPQKVGGATDAEEYGAFGRDVDIVDNYAIISAGSRDALEVNAGVVYIFKRKDNGMAADTWEISKTLTAQNEDESPDQGASSYFGNKLSISGDVLAVSAYNRDVGAVSRAGVVYLFRKDTGGTDNWGIEKRLTAVNTDGSPNLLKDSNFGYDIALSGDNLIAGAHEYDNNSGQVFLFSKDNGGSNNWGITKIFTAESSPGVSASQDGQSFGSHVSMHGKEFIAGAPGYKAEDVFGSGAAYIFDEFPAPKPEPETPTKKDKDVFVPTEQPKGVTVTMDMNTKKVKTGTELKTEYDTGSLGEMLGANIYEFEATVTNLGLGYFCFNSSSLGDRKAGDVSLFKLYPDKASREFVYSTEKNPNEEGFFWITDEANSGQYIDPNTILEGGRTYTVNYSVRDNGEYDLDSTAGKIHDPVVPGTSSGGSGCVLNPQAGMSVELAGFFIAALIGICARRFRRQ